MFRSRDTAHSVLGWVPLRSAVIKVSSRSRQQRDRAREREREKGEKGREIWLCSSKGSVQFIEDRFVKSNVCIEHAAQRSAAQRGAARRRVVAATAQAITA